ncbi:MAG: catechol 2,3-dioxygenase [Acidimicrobiales bacterium]|jgi:catechol 2,3-dioxygenase
MPMNVRWSHCVLKVRDIDAMINFYCDALGFKLADQGELGPEQHIAFLSGSSSDHHQLGLIDGRSSDDTSSLDHNAFRVDSVEDVQAMVQWINNDERIDKGFPITHGNAVSVYFKDPEGNGIEIFCDTPWHVPQPQVGFWDPSQDAEQVLAGVKANFEDKTGFGPIGDYQAEQAKTFGED